MTKKLNLTLLSLAIIISLLAITFNGIYLNNSLKEEIVCDFGDNFNTEIEIQRNFFGKIKNIETENGVICSVRGDLDK